MTSLQIDSGAPTQPPPPPLLLAIAETAQCVVAAVDTPASHLHISPLINAHNAYSRKQAA